MAGVNKVILVGNLGKDPEPKTLDNGVKLVKFSLATNEYYKTKTGEREEKTEWHNVICWRGLAETAEKILKRGSKIYLEGKIRNRSYDDKDGNKRYVTEIEADTFVTLDKKEAGESEDPRNGGYSEPTIEVPPSTDDDLPF
jgi:single-strand DNA-binding protein